MSRPSGLVQLFPKRRPQSQWAPEGIYGDPAEDVNRVNREIADALDELTASFNIQPPEGDTPKDQR